MKTLLKETADFASELISTLPEGFLYHNLQHSTEVVEAVKEIGYNSGLSEIDVDLIQIAAWFHDTGFIKDYETHERFSIAMAEDFLSEKKLPEGEIYQVLNLIRVTKPNSGPSNKLEEVIKDADVLNIGTNDFFVKNILLKKEREILTHVYVSEKAWFKSTYNFIVNTDFYTNYAKQKYGQVRRNNIELLDEISREKIKIESFRIKE